MYMEEGMIKKIITSIISPTAECAAVKMNSHLRKGLD